jgi:pimeloyl-ACP methyl ester carboxylesterase
MIMERKFKIVDGIELAYVEQNVEAIEAIIFVHGNSGSADTWYRQFDDLRFSKYRMIAVDLPAHGQSESSSNPENDYSVIGLGRLVAELIDHLVGNGPFILVGFSLGTNVIAESLEYFNKPIGIALLASCILGEGFGLQKVFLPNPKSSSFFEDSASRENVEEFVNESCLSSTKDKKLIIDDYFNTKPFFRSTLGKTAAESKFRDEIELIKRSGIPLFIVYGINEKSIDCNYLDQIPLSIWNNTIYKIPNASHYLHLDQPDKFNELLSKYLIQRFKLYGS